LEAAEPEPLDYAVPEEPLSLAMLSAFLKAPIRSFYNRSLQVHFEDISKDDTDNEVFALAGLDRWQADQELTTQCVLKSESEDDFRQRLSEQLEGMVRRGSLGMGLTEMTLR